jgi:hypothetical protein
VTLLVDNIDIIRRRTQALIDESKDVYLEVNTEEAKYMLQLRHQNTGLNHDITLRSRCFGLYIMILPCFR